ncbi:MAG: amino acid ABC transporter permease [Deltaproteobacteria bacterium]|jgi:polar amino acid transport system permease protein|nr:amino acid ABC transporter permease [Deltaproteobacteria bacterium]
MPDSALSVFMAGRNMARLMEGLWITVWISLASVGLSVVLGIPAGLLMSSKKKIVSGILRIYLEVIRVMPILVLLFLFYYSLSKVSGINLSAYFVSVLVFTLWGTAEMADLVRAAVTSIPVHQRESARALGLSELRANLLVIVPQAVRRLLPGVINLTTRMIKTTPFVFFINHPDLMKVGQQIVEVAGMRNHLASVWVYGFIFLVYFLICWPISLLSRWLEGRWKS